MKKYRYEGPVMEFDRCIERSWTGETIAASERKARSNLAYQYKKQQNKVARVKIYLPGDIVTVMEV